MIGDVNRGSYLYMGSPSTALNLVVLALLQLCNTPFNRSASVSSSIDSSRYCARAQRCCLCEMERSCFRERERKHRFFDFYLRHLRNVQHCSHSHGHQLSSRWTREEQRLTVVPSYESISVLVSFDTVDPFFCSFQRNVHVSIQAIQNT